MPNPRPPDKKGSRFNHWCRNKDMMIHREDGTRFMLYSHDTEPTWILDSSQVIEQPNIKKQYETRNRKSKPYRY